MVHSCMQHPPVTQERLHEQHQLALTCHKCSKLCAALANETFTSVPHSLSTYSMLWLMGGEGGRRGGGGGGGLMLEQRTRQWALP